MMNTTKILFLFFVLIPLFVVQSQSRFPIKATSEWRINYEFSGTVDPKDHVNGDEEYKYHIIGDTIIDSIKYFKLFKTGIMYLDVPFHYENKYVGAIRDTSNVFLFIPDDDIVEDTLYNFNLNVGDTVDGFEIGEIDTLDDGRKRFRFYIWSVHCGAQDTYIEGIGWLGGLLEGNSCSGHIGVRGAHLLCYSEDGQPVFINTVAMDAKETCNEPGNGIEIPEQGDISIIVQNNKIILPDKYFTPNKTIIIYNIAGTICYSNIFRSSFVEIDISQLSAGTYLVSIIEKDKNVVKKFVKP